NDYYITLGVRPDLQFGSNDFTVSYWIRLPSGYKAGDLPFFTDALSSTFGPGFVFAPAYGYGVAGGTNTTPVEPGCWAFTIYNGTGSGAGLGGYGNQLAEPYPGTINDGKWHN